MSKVQKQPQTDTGTDAAIDSSYPQLPQFPTPLECRKWANNHPAASCEADKDILSFIAFLQSKDKACQGGAYPRYEVIAEKVKRTRRTVIRRVNRLVELGVILKERRSWQNCKQANISCIFTVYQDGVTDDLHETGTVTVDNGYGRDKEVERNYIVPSNGRGDTSNNNVTPQCHNQDDLSSPGVSKQDESVTEGVTKDGGRNDTVSPPTRVLATLSDLSISDSKEYVSNMSTLSDRGSASASPAAHTWMPIMNDLSGRAVRLTSLNTDLEKIVFKDGTAMEYRVTTLAARCKAQHPGNLVKAIDYVTLRPEGYDKHCQNADTFNKYLSGLTL